MSHSLTDLLSHVVFSTKYREPFITEEIKELLHRYLAGIVKERRGRALAIGGVEDHVHLLVRYPPSISVAELVKSIKGGSSRWVNEQLRPRTHFGWQRGYAAFSVSQSMADRVCAYIEKQEEHHREIEFEDELVLLLDKHNIAFDQELLFETRPPEPSPTDRNDA